MSTEPPAEPAEPGSPGAGVRGGGPSPGDPPAGASWPSCWLAWASLRSSRSTRTARPWTSAEPASRTWSGSSTTSTSARLDCRRELEDLDATKVGLQTGSNSRALAEAETRQRLAALGVLAGTVPATGPGVMVRITDPRGAVNAGWCSAPCRSCATRGRRPFRSTTCASWRPAGSTTARPACVVSGTKLRAPYTIYAIGDARTIAEALRIPGGVVDSVRGVGGQVSVTRAHERHRERVAARPDASVRSAGAIQLVIPAS